jgi:hypothetical protein
MFKISARKRRALNRSTLAIEAFAEVMAFPKHRCVAFTSKRRIAGAVPIGDRVVVMRQRAARPVDDHIVVPVLAAVNGDF